MKELLAERSRVKDELIKRCESITGEIYKFKARRATKKLRDKEDSDNKKALPESTGRALKRV